jgi:hypothetical protein
MLFTVAVLALASTALACIVTLVLGNYDPHGSGY